MMVDADGGSRRRVLVVEDEALLRWSIRQYLESRGYEVEAFGEGTEAMRRLESTDYDVVVADLNLPGVDGLWLAGAARKRNPHTQVIIVTGDGSKESVIAALRQGVLDYLEKPFEMELLLVTVEKAFEKCRMEKELLRLSRTDGLTGLFNQRHFYEVLEKEMKRAGRQDRPLSLVLIDVDDFKGYNDRFGHLEGDNILARIASCVRKGCRRDVDRAFRYGGDEFVLVLPEADREAAESVAARIFDFLREEGIDLTLSIGVTEISRGQVLKEAVREADEAMYLAKQFGGNRTITFEQSRRRPD